jgi:hypothetical protein
MTDDTNVLLKYYEEHRTQGRHAESQRSIVSNYIITISAAILGFTIQKGFALDSLPLTIFLIIIGTYGAIISWKLYERFEYNMTLAKQISKRIAELHPEMNFDEIRRLACHEHEKKYPNYKKIRLYKLWIALHILISAIGVVCSIIIIIHGQ